MKVIDLEGIGNAFYTRESFPPFFIKIEKSILFRLGSFFKLYVVLYIYIRSLTYNANRLQRRIKFLK